MTVFSSASICEFSIFYQRIPLVHFAGQLTTISYNSCLIAIQVFGFLILTCVKTFDSGHGQRMKPNE